MSRVPGLKGLILFLFLLTPSVLAEIIKVNNTVSPHLNANSDQASLKILLRLPDDTAFTGISTVRVLASDGKEVPSTAAPSEGERNFQHLSPGSYAVEASAPGFLSAKETVEIQTAKQIATIFLVLKPDQFVESAANSATSSQAHNANAGKPNWLPPDIDGFVPPVEPGVACPLPDVLNGAGQRMVQLVSNLEKFSATEKVEHFRVDAAGERQGPEKGSYEYLVEVSQTTKGVFELSEYRNGTMDPSQFPAGIATMGVPSLALSIFHPVTSVDYKFACEGMGFWSGRPAWQVHFEQRPDQLNRTRGYVIHKNYYSVALRGRAWIDAGTFQVIRLETELMKPVKEIELTQERFSIEYGPVQFRTHNQVLWLPETAEMYWERHGKRYYREHDFSNFKIFDIDTAQKIQAPKESYCFTNSSDRDIASVLTVNPVTGLKLAPVSIKFTIPAGRSVCKTVGPGKDVNMRIEDLGSAKLEHTGPEGSIAADANFVKKSTMDLVPESELKATP